jgi:phosphocarrier protein HPr
VATKEIRRKVKIVNRLGLHARAAGKLRNLAANFPCKIDVIKGNITANAKSLLGLMAIEGCKGTEIEIRARGDQAEDAVVALVDLIQNRFGEDE